MADEKDLQGLRAVAEWAANHGGGQKLTTRDAIAIIGMYLRGIGLQQDRWGNYPVDEKTRWNIGTTVLRKQARRPDRGWYNLSSRSLISAATGLLSSAGKVLGDSTATARAEKVKEGRQKTRERAATKEQQRRGLEMAAKEIAWRYPEEVRMNFFGETIQAEKLAAMKQEIAEKAAFYTNFIFKAGRDPGGDEAYASLDRPPLLPVFQPTDYFWTEKLDGVEYSIEMKYRGSSREKIAIVSIGSHGSMFRADPLSGRAVSSNPDAVGDGGLDGSIRFVNDEHGKRLYADIYLITAKETKRGVGSRLMKAWCKMMRGLGIRSFLVRAIGNEGEAFFRALHARGSIRILDTIGRDAIMECG